MSDIKSSNIRAENSLVAMPTKQSNYKHSISRNGKHRTHAVICSENGKHFIPNFEDVQISTMTVIAHTNLTINTEKFFKYIPITDYIMVRKKRGRKRKIQPEDPNKNIPPGSIISMTKRRCVRGATLKIKKKKSKTYWRHSVSAVMMLEDGKMINVKVPRNGKLQMTGCKSIKHAIKFVKHIYSLMIEAEEWTGETLFTYQTPGEEEEEPSDESNVLEAQDPQDLVEIEPVLDREEDNGLTVFFRIVMRNIDFHVGYKIRRDSLNSFINFHTEFRSIFESSMGPSVNIKIKSQDRFDENISRLRITADGECMEDIVDFSEFYELLPSKDQKDVRKPDKYHTFLCFASGSIIMSSAGREMSGIFYKLVKLLIENRSKLEDKPTEKTIDASWIDDDTEFIM